MSYDHPESCDNCGGLNKVSVVDSLDGYMHEADTECQECGHTDRWSHGRFESSSEMVGVSKKYTPTAAPNLRKY